MADLVHSLEQAFDHAAQVVSGVRAEQLTAPTPCPEWDLDTLLRHMTGVIVDMGRGAAGEGLLPDRDAYDLGEDVGGQFRVEADRTLAAWKARGLDGTVDVGAGPMPVPAALSVNLVDTTTHTWDVAQASGQPPALPDDLATTVLEVAQGFVDQVRDVVGIGPPVTVGDDAPPTDRLVAFMGRQP